MYALFDVTLGLFAHTNIEYILFINNLCDHVRHFIQFYYLYFTLTSEPHFLSIAFIFNSIVCKYEIYLYILILNMPIIYNKGVFFEFE